MSTFDASFRRRGRTSRRTDVETLESSTDLVGGTPLTVQLGQVRVLLAAFVLTLALLDTGGLLTWARRLELGSVRSSFLAVLVPWHEVLEAVGLDQPRRWLIALADRTARAAGGGEDPLMAGGWVSTDEPPEAPLPLGASPSPEETHAEASEPTLGELSEADPPLPEGDRAPSTAPASAFGPLAAAAPWWSGDLGPSLATPPLLESGARPTLYDTEATALSMTVLLVGDSMLAGSLGSELRRVLERDRRFKVVTAFQTATGLNRPDVFDWMKVVPRLLERERPGLIICSFGANDAADIRDGQLVARFGTSSWRKTSRMRIEAMMRLLAAGEARVLWLGLPPMRNPRFSERTAAMNRLANQAAQSVPRVEYLEPGMLVADSEGRYATFLRDGQGRFVRLRLDDGVHYAPQGARRVARWLVDWTRERAPSL